MKSFCKYDQERSGYMKDLTSRTVDEYQLSMYTMELILSVADFIEQQRMRNSRQNINAGKQVAESGH